MMDCNNLKHTLQTGKQCRVYYAAQEQAIEPGQLNITFMWKISLLFVECMENVKKRMRM